MAQLPNLKENQVLSAPNPSTPFEPYDAIIGEAQQRLGKSIIAISQGMREPSSGDDPLQRDEARIHAETASEPAFEKAMKDKRLKGDGSNLPELYNEYMAPAKKYVEQFSGRPARIAAVAIQDVINKRLKLASDDMVTMKLDYHKQRVDAITSHYSNMVFSYPEKRKELEVDALKGIAETGIVNSVHIENAKINLRKQGVVQALRKYLDTDTRNYKAAKALLHSADAADMSETDFRYYQEDIENKIDKRYGQARRYKEDKRQDDERIEKEVKETNFDDYSEKLAVANNPISYSAIVDEIRANPDKFEGKDFRTLLNSNDSNVTPAENEKSYMEGAQRILDGTSKSDLKQYVSSQMAFGKMSGSTSNTLLNMWAAQNPSKSTNENMSQRVRDVYMINKEAFTSKINSRRGRTILGNPAKELSQYEQRFLVQGQIELNTAARQGEEALKSKYIELMARAIPDSTEHLPKVSGIPLNVWDNKDKSASLLSNLNTQYILEVQDNGITSRRAAELLEQIEALTLTVEYHNEKAKADKRVLDYQKSNPPAIDDMMKRIMKGTPDGR